jgi:hypothetical protein
MAVIRRAFSALVKAALWAFGEQYFVLLCETSVSELAKLSRSFGFHFQISVGIKDLKG